MLFLAVLGLRYCLRAFSSCRERGCSLLAVWGLPVVLASLVEHRLSGVLASVAVAHGLGCTVAFGIFLAPHSSTLAWRIPGTGGAWWAAVHGVAKSRTWLSVFTFAFHFLALEKEMATHSSVLAWRIPWTEEPGRLSSMWSHRVGHDWSYSAAAADQYRNPCLLRGQEDSWSLSRQGSPVLTFFNKREEAIKYNQADQKEENSNIIIGV